MEEASVFTIMAEDMRDIGFLTNVMEKALKFSVMDVLILVRMKKVKLVGRVFLLGLMEMFTMVSG